MTEAPIAGLNAIAERPVVALCIRPAECVTRIRLLVAGRATQPVDLIAHGSTADADALSAEVDTVAEDAVVRTIHILFTPLGRAWWRALTAEDQHKAAIHESRSCRTCHHVVSGLHGSTLH